MQVVRKKGFFEAKVLDFLTTVKSRYRYYDTCWDRNEAS